MPACTKAIASFAWSAQEVTDDPNVVHALSMHGIGEAVDIAFIRAGAEQRARVGLARFRAGRDDANGPRGGVRSCMEGPSSRPWQLPDHRRTAPRSCHGARLLGDVVRPCRVFVPKLAALQTRYGAQGLNVIGVSTEDAKDVALFAERATMPYAVAVDQEGKRHGRTVFSAYRPSW